MPLNLTPEEMDSLNEGVFVEGSAIVKLLSHYNQIPKVKTLESAINPASFDVRLGEVTMDRSNDTFLLPLGVNAIDKSFNAQNHYVGIIIKRLPSEGISEGGAEYPDKYKVTYIDPMGARPNKEIVAQIRSKFGIDIAISLSQSRLQYADLVGGAPASSKPGGAGTYTRDGGGAQYFIGNDKDCGPMLVYQMTKLIHGNGLSKSESKDHSLAIGKKLREILRSDNGKDAADSFRLGQDDIAVPVPAITPASPRVPLPPTREKITARDLSSGRTSRSPDAEYRRLDSLARIITGQDVCAAVAFNGDKILYSNNKSKNSEVSRRIFQFLQKVALSRTKIADVERNFGREAEELVDFSISENERSNQRRKHRKSTDSRRRKDRERMVDDFNKLVCSLAVDSSEEKKFSPDVENALREGKFEFVRGDLDTDGRKKERPVHAEMAILDRIVQADGFAVSDPEVVAGRKPFYIGISKLCCKNCHLAITSLNENSTTKVKEGTAEEREGIVVDTRGEHLDSFPWPEPNFFTIRPVVKIAYVVHESGFNPDAVGTYAADKSSSEPETDVAPRHSPTAKKYQDRRR